MPTVRTVNNHGDTAEVQVSDDMLATLEGKSRQGELRSVEVIGDDSPALVEVEVEYRPRAQVLNGTATDPEPEVVVVVDEREGHPGQVVPETTDDTADDGDLDALRAEYETVAGEAPDGRWQAKRLRKEIDARRTDGDA